MSIVTYSETPVYNSEFPIASSEHRVFEGYRLSTVGCQLPFYNGTGVELVISSNMASLWSDFLRVET